MFNAVIVTTLADADTLSVSVEDDVVVEVFTFDTEERAKTFVNDVRKNGKSLPNRVFEYAYVCKVNDAVTIEQYKELLNEETYSE